MAIDDDPPEEWGEQYRHETAWEKKGKTESDLIDPTALLNRLPAVFDDVRQHVITAPAKKNGAAGAPQYDQPAAPAIIIQRNWLDWADLASRNPPPRQWLVEHWLSYSPTLCAGKGGIGKTLIAQELATALALGVPFIDIIAHQVPTLMWCCEDDHDELWRRELAICDMFKHDLEDLTNALTIDARAGFENELYAPDYNRCIWTSVAKELSEQINDTHAEVVILDNVAQMYGGNENDRHHVTAFCNGLTGLGHGRPICVLILAHPAKQSSSEFSGSSAWENACRMRWWLADHLPDHAGTAGDEDDDDDQRFLAKRKVNYTDKDYRRFLYRNGVLAPTGQDTNGRDLYLQIKARRVEEVVLHAVELLAQRSIYGVEQEGARSLLKLIFDYNLNQGHERKEIKHALRKLIFARRLVHERVERTSCRHWRVGLVIKTAPPTNVVPFPPEDK